MDQASLLLPNYVRQKMINESTADADASVEVPKLHNIKLLIASFYTHIDYNYHDDNFAACTIQNHRETQRVGNDRR